MEQEDFVVIHLLEELAPLLMKITIRNTPTVTGADRKYRVRGSTTEEVEDLFMWITNSIV